MMSLKKCSPGVLVAGLLLVAANTAADAHGKGGPGNKPGPGHDHHDHHGHAHGPDQKLAGVWLVSMMPCNCTTGDSIPNQAYEALYTFHDDGTLTVWVQNSTITTTRSPSHGIWKSAKRGPGFQMTFVHLRYSPQTGAYLGRQDAAGIITLSGRGDELSIDSSATVYDVNGAVTARACANASGVKLVLPD